jgi:membrane-anchored glycerophosphoryl diester phosphodiesterase (GDPDase)
VTTRSELRAQRQEKVEKSVEKSIEETPKKRHFLYCLWGVICVTLLGLTLLINSTLLNVNFVKEEVTSSSLESVMLNQVNSSLTQYGISTSVLKKSDTDKLINQAIDQVYAGEKLILTYRL